MAKKIFVSYKYKDDSVLQIDPTQPTTVRDYIDIIEAYLQEDHIYKGERDNEDLRYLSEDQIEESLKDRIYDSTVTIVFISKDMKTIEPELEQWIPWEIAYSLKEKTRNDRTSYTNAMLAIVIPDENNSFEYIAERKNCQYCHCISWKINQLFTILGKNMFNKKINNTYTCPSGTCGTIHTGNDHSYIQPVKWYDFMNNKEYYINLAIERNNQIGNYEITKEA